MLAKRKGVPAREGLKEARSKAMTRCTKTGSEAGPLGRAGERSRSPSSIKGGSCIFGGCVVKAVELTSGDLQRCSGDGTGNVVRHSDPFAEVSRGRSSRAVGEAL